MSDDQLLSVQAKTGKRRRETTVADVLDATRRLLQSGITISSLSVDRIVTEAGIARATFYLHFSDKHALIARLAEDEIAWRNEIGAEELASPDLSWDALETMMTEIVRRWVADKAVLSAIITLAEQDPQVDLIWRASMREVAEKAAIQFRARWSADDPDKPTDTDTIAEVFTWMFERCSHKMAAEPKSIPILARSMAEIIWRVLNYRTA